MFASEPSWYSPKLFIWKSEWWGDIFHLLVHSINAFNSQAWDEVTSQEFHLNLSLGWQGVEVLGHHLLSPRHINRKLLESWSKLGLETGTSNWDAGTLSLGCCATMPNPLLHSSSLLKCIMSSVKYISSVSCWEYFGLAERTVIHWVTAPQPPTLAIHHSTACICGSNYCRHFM